MKDKLTEKFGLPIAFSMVVGIVIGAGIFFSTPRVIEASGGNATIVLLAWIVGGFVTICSGLTMAELAAAIPETGGITAYIYHIYGKHLSFVSGIVLTFIYFPGLIAVLSYLFAMFLLSFFGITFENNAHMYTSMVGICVFLFIYFFATFPRTSGGKLQLIFTIGKFVPIILVVILGIFFGKETHVYGPFTEGFSSTKASLAAFFTAFSITAFAYDGWIYVGNISKEIKHPGRNLPLAIIGGLLIITLAYTLLNAALLQMGPIKEIQDVETTIAEFMPKGAILSKVILIGILTSIYGGINGLSVVASRMPYGMSVEENFFARSFFTRIKNDTPRDSSIFMGGYITFLFIVIAVSGQIFEGENGATFIFNFSDIPIAAVWIFYLLCFVGVFILRRSERLKKRPKLERPYKVPLYPIVPLISVAAGCVLVYVQVLEKPGLSSIVGCVMLLALGVSVFFRKYLEPSKEQ